MELTDRLHEILEQVQEAEPQGSCTALCKHGELLCECSEDCPECFEEALRVFVAEMKQG